jgi:elongation factor Ts
MADMSLIKKLREMTGAGVLDCKNALGETNDDLKAASELLQKKAKATASKKSTRTAAEGLVGNYVHPGSKIAVLCEVNCETDFAAKNEDFQTFVRDVCMHIAAMSPYYLDEAAIPTDDVERQKGIFLAQMDEDPKMASKPPQVKEKIIAGKMKKWLSEVCLLDQAFVKDSDKTVRGYCEEVVGKIRENIKVRRFVRFQVGEESF